MTKPLLQPQSDRVLADWVTGSIREAILQGYFEPGEKIDQDHIAEELKVSRTPIREALKALEAEGFIEIRPHRGAFVTKLTRKDISNVYEIRKLLEAEAVRQVTPVIPSSVLDELERNIAEAQTRFEAGDAGSHFESDVRFHETIINYVENELLQEMLDSLNNRIMRVRRFALRQPGSHLSDSLEEHREIIRAMRGRNAEKAAEAMHTHLAKSALRIQKLKL